MKKLTKAIALGFVLTGAAHASAGYLDRLSEWNQCINEAGKHYRVDPDVIRAVILAESSGDPRAVNTSNPRTKDLGLMQISTAYWMGELEPLGIRDQDLFKPCQNIVVGTWILHVYIKRKKGDVWKAVSAYHNSNPAIGDAYMARVKRYYEAIQRERNRMISFALAETGSGAATDLRRAID